MRLHDNWQWEWGWKWKIDHMDATYIDLGLDMHTNILNIKLSQYNMVKCIKQYLSNIWSSIHEKSKQQWVGKKRFWLNKFISRKLIF